MLVPGQPMPAEGQPDDSSPSNTPASSPSTTATATSSATATPSPDSSGLGGGAIAGIVVGVVAFVAILVALFFVLGRNRVYQKWMSSQDSRTERTARWALFNTQPSAPQPPGDQAMAGWDQTGSPDTAQGPLSPSLQQPSGHWSWKFQQQAPYQQPAPPAPTELEATSVGQVYPQKGS
jgi:hypothetical protein